MVAHQRVKILRRLVVGGMRLVDELRCSRDVSAQLARLLGPIVDDLVVIELDTGLDDQRDSARPGRGQIGCFEGAPVGLDRACAASGVVTVSASNSSPAPPGAGTSVPIT
jgi:hypothetical protein